MSGYFRRTFRTDWSKTNANGHIHLSEYFRFVVETAWDWAAANGLGVAESEQIGLGWMIRETEIALHRPLVPEDVFEFTIWLGEWRRVRGTRFFELVLQDGGETIAQGAQQIVSVDLDSLRPTVLPDEIINKFRADKPRIIQQSTFPRHEFKQEPAHAEQRTVEWSDLDSLEHVNNANYAAFAEDAATNALAAMDWTPAKLRAQGSAVMSDRVHIRYQSPVSWGETLDLSVHLVGATPGGGAWHIDMKRSQDETSVAQCRIDWSLANLSTGEAEDLPNGLVQELQRHTATGSNKGG